MEAAAQASPVFHACCFAPSNWKGILSNKRANQVVPATLAKDQLPFGFGKMSDNIGKAVTRAQADERMLSQASGDSNEPVTIVEKSVGEASHVKIAVEVGNLPEQVNMGSRRESVQDGNSSPCQEGGGAPKMKCLPEASEGVLEQKTMAGESQAPLSEITSPPRDADHDATMPTISNQTMGAPQFCTTILEEENLSREDGRASFSGSVESRGYMAGCLHCAATTGALDAMRKYWAEAEQRAREARAEAEKMEKKEKRMVAQLSALLKQVELRQVQVEHLSGLVTQQQVEFMALETRYMEHLQAEQGLSTPPIGSALGRKAEDLCSSEEPSIEPRGWSVGGAGKSVSAGNSNPNTNPCEGPTQLSPVENTEDDAGFIGSGQSVDESCCETNPCNGRAEREEGRSAAFDRKVPVLGLADAWAVARTDCSPDDVSESSCDSSECSFEFDSSPTEAVFERAEPLRSLPVDRKERRGSRNLVERHEHPGSGQGGFGEFFLCSIQSQLNELISKEGENQSASHSWGQLLSGETVPGQFVIEWDLQALSDGPLGVDDEVENAAPNETGPVERRAAAWRGSDDEDNTALPWAEKGLEHSESGVGNSETELGPSEELTRGGDLDKGEDRSRPKCVPTKVGSFVEDARSSGTVGASGSASEEIWRGGVLLDLGSAYWAGEADGGVASPYGDTWETELGSLSAYAGQGGLTTEPMTGGGKRNSSQAVLGGRGASDGEHMELTDVGSQYEDGSLFGWGSEGDSVRAQGDVIGAPHGSDTGWRGNGREDCGILLESRLPTEPETSGRASRTQRQNSPGGGERVDVAHEVVVEAFALDEHVELGNYPGDMDAQRSSDAFDSCVPISPWGSPLGESYNPVLADLKCDSPLRRRSSSAPQEGRTAWGGGTKPPQLVPSSPPHVRSNPPSPVHLALSGSPTAMTPVPPITPKINSLPSPHFTSPTKKPRSAVVSAVNLEFNAPKDDLASAAWLTGSRSNGKLARKDSLPRRRDAFGVIGLSAQETEKTLVPRPPASAAPNRKPSVRQLAATVGTGRSSDKENGSANVPTFTLKLGELGNGRKLRAEAEYRKRGGFGKRRRAMENGKDLMGGVDNGKMSVNSEVAAPEPPPKPRATSSRPLFRALLPSAN